jgi:hypothetical protein
MKNKIPQLCLLTSLAAGLLLAAATAQAANYAGNGNTGFGGSVGNGVLSVTDDGTNITFNLQRGSSGNLNDCLVIYIDTGIGGYADTSSFTDTSGYGEQVAISGYNGGSSRSLMTFTNGFRPSYAVAIKNSYTDLWSLANPASLSYLTGSSESGASSANFSLTFNAAQIGLTPGTNAKIRIFGTLISTTAYRSTEAIAGNDFTLFSQGYNAFTQTAFATYSFDAPPSPSYPVTFAVDMTAQIASGAFNPGNGDTIYAAGTFQTNVWTGFSLTNNPTAANTNIYSGTYPDYNPTNTAELFKFQFHSVANNTNVFEDLDNRPFTLTAAGVTNALVYFNDVYASPSATSRNLTFSIDMTAQVDLGNFNPANGDTVQVLGTFENPKWTVGGFILTNNPTINGNRSNLYSGTIADGNYTGSFENYKFVIVTTLSTNYESFNGNANRDFFTPANALTFPLAYFNGVVSIYSTPITFQVDMTVPLLTGTFNPGNGDMIVAAGTFQTNAWTIGAFPLTNNPTAASSNVYSGIYPDPNAPGAGEQYLFVIIRNGVNNYETVPNRTFILTPPSMTLPVVQWSNDDTNNILLVPTTVTFTVNMTNAVDDFGYPFNSAADAVVVNGNFMNPTWPNFWTDALLGGFDYTGNLLNNDGTDLLYTGTFTVAAGSPLAIQYKYGIVHGYSGTGNTNADNEAGFGLNHTRYIRATGTYNFPVDIFGIQQTNLAAATEPSVGSLALGKPVSGQLPISWNGRPGVYLQYSTNLTGPWIQISATDGASSSSWPQTNRAVFFRLVNP